MNCFSRILQALHLRAPASGIEHSEAEMENSLHDLLREAEVAAHSSRTMVELSNRFTKQLRATREELSDLEILLSGGGRRDRRHH